MPAPEDNHPDDHEKPPKGFDTIRASFWLVAGVLIVHCFVVLVGVVTCVWMMDRLPPTMEQTFQCDTKGRLSDLLAGALAAALAFAGGFRRKDP